MSADDGPVEPVRRSGGEPEGGLGALVGGIRRLLLRRAAAAVTLWLLVVAAATLAAAWALSGPDGWGAGSTVPLILDLGLLVAGVGGVWVLMRLGRRRLSEVEIARGLDRIGEFGTGTVQGSLELSRSTPPGVSAALARSSETAVLRALPADDPDRLARPLGTAFVRWTRRAAGVLAFALPGLVLLGVMQPDRSLTAWSGLLRPTAVMARPPLPALHLDPSEGPLPRGSPLEVVVEARGRETVSLRWQFDGDVARTREAPVRDGRARFDLGALEAPVEYRAAAPDGARTATVRIEPQDPLLVADLRVELVYPSHTGRSPEQFRRDVPPLEIPAGTSVRVDGRASRPLASAALRRSGEDGSGETATELSVEADRFSGRWSPRRSGRYAWDLRAPDGSEPASVPSPLELTVVADSAPSIELTFPGRDTVLPLNDRQPLVIRAADDYGLGSLELVAYRVSSFGEHGEPVVRELRTGGVRAAIARPVLDVSDWELMPGDTVRYRARVTDNRPGPQTARTREYALRVPRRSEAARSVQEKLESAARTVDSLASSAARAAEQTRELERRGTERRAESGGADRSRTGDAALDGGASSRPRETSSFEAREQVRRAVERQQELVSRADSVRSELAEARRTLEEAALADPELREDLEELQSLMERAAPEELRQELRRMSEELDQMNSRELENALERMARDQESFRRSVEQSLERFRRAAAEQDFRTTAREARELADEESVLADAMESGEQSERRIRQQEDLAERTARLQERMEELEQQLSRLGEQEARQGVEEARRSSRQALREMEDAARRMQEGATGQGEEDPDRRSPGRQGRTEQGQAATRQGREAQQERETRQAGRDTEPGRDAGQDRQAEQGPEGREERPQAGGQERTDPESRDRQAAQRGGGQQQTGQQQTGQQQAGQQSRGRRGQQAGGQRGSRASSSARAASDRLQRSADRLDSARQQMSRARTAETRRAFQQASAEALALARRQGELQQRMRGAGQEERAELRGDQAALLEGLRNLSSSLSRPASQAPEQGGQVQQAVQEATNSVQRTLDALEGEGGGGRPSPSAASTEAVDALNRAARAAARAGRQGGGQGGGGGSPQLMRQLQQVAQQQGGLAERTGSLQPMQLGPSSLRRQLGQMAQEQESVADELGELARRPGSGEALGDLETMAQEARDLAQRLEGGRLEPETVRRQERLFHRLLDAGRSLEKDERSSERRSRTAEPVPPPAVQPLTAEDRGGARFSLPRADVLRALPPAQRALVVRYFERLNRAGADGEPEGDDR